MFAACYVLLWLIRKVSEESVTSKVLEEPVSHHAGILEESLSHQGYNAYHQFLIRIANISSSDISPYKMQQL